jgi:hypothetical protein
MKTRSDGDDIVHLPQKRSRPVRGAPITCLNFGFNREETYSLYFFCHNCRMYEQKQIHKKCLYPSAPRPAKYACDAGHTDPNHPTVTKEQMSHYVMLSYQKPKATISVTQTRNTTRTWRKTCTDVIPHHNLSDREHVMHNNNENNDDDRVSYQPNTLLLSECMPTFDHHHNDHNQTDTFTAGECAPQPTSNTSVEDVVTPTIQEIRDADNDILDVMISRQLQTINDLRKCCDELKIQLDTEMQQNASIKRQHVLEQELHQLTIVELQNQHQSQIEQQLNNIEQMKIDHQLEIEQLKRQHLSEIQHLTSVKQNLTQKLGIEKDTSYNLRTKLDNEREHIMEQNNLIKNLKNQISNKSVLSEDGTLVPNAIDVLNNQLSSVKKEHALEKKANSQLRQQVKQLMEDLQGKDFVSKIKHTMTTESFLHLIEQITAKVGGWKNRNHETLANNMITFFWSSSVLSGHLKYAIIKQARTYYRTQLFSPEKILELMDMNGGQLSYQGLDLL